MPNKVVAANALTLVSWWLTRTFEGLSCFHLRPPARGWTLNVLPKTKPSHYNMKKRKVLLHPASFLIFLAFCVSNISPNLRAEIDGFYMAGSNMTGISYGLQDFKTSIRISKSGTNWKAQIESYNHDLTLMLSVETILRLKDGEYISHDVPTSGKLGRTYSEVDLKVTIEDAGPIIMRITDTDVRKHGVRPRDVFAAVFELNDTTERAFNIILSRNTKTPTQEKAIPESGSTGRLAESERSQTPSATSSSVMRNREQDHLAHIYKGRIFKMKKGSPFGILPLTYQIVGVNANKTRVTIELYPSGEGRREVPGSYIPK